MDKMNGPFNNNQLVIKKSPVVIAKNFIVLQMAAVAVFFLSGVLLDYGEIYKHLPIASSFSFHIAEAIGIFTLETVMVFVIFFRWYKEYYDIKSDKIIYSKGIIFRAKTVIPLKTIRSVRFRQGPLGRLIKYGAVDLEDKTSGKIVVLDHIPEPQRCVETILRLKEVLTDLQPIASASSFEDLVTNGEHERLEFKTSFRWDANQNKVNKNLEKATMKTIAAFLNSEGGQLILGVNDSGNITGLDNDYRSLPKPNADGFQNHFTNVFHSIIGPEFRQFVNLSIHKVGDKECCLVRVAFSDRPVYLKLDVGGEEFYIRTGNGTTGLKLSEATSYIDSRWKAKLL